ncbi:MAG: hypothetical protein EBS53_11085 [Bacteroidetes bacterium]|nr:hypothetical protein [Bacteroidota bacterium]
MSIKTTLSLLFVILTSASYAQRVVLTFQSKSARDSNPQIDYRDLTIADGQQVQITWLAGTSGSMKAWLGEFAATPFSPIDSLSRVQYYSQTGGTNGYYVNQAKGPCKVRITPSFGPIIEWVYGQGNIPMGWTQVEGICEYEITNISSGSASTQIIPSASVVVPANAIGDVDVLLEQSTDMITWTQCLPGTYNASTQKRFFRVRAVEK